jgi:hypothetical protein
MRHAGPVHRFRLFLLISGSLLLFACRSMTGTARFQQATPDPNQSSVQWIKQHAHALTTTDPQASLADLEPLRPVVGSAAIVGLGEETY